MRINPYAAPGPVSMDELSQRLHIAARVLEATQAHHAALISRTLARDGVPLTFNGVSGRIVKHLERKK